MISRLASSPTGLPAGPWLSLGQASRLLGITPATLRRWSDSGQVPTFVTPGGHRRFPRSVIEGMVPDVRSRRPSLAGLGASTERMAQAYRRARPVERGSGPKWLAALSDQDRAEFRERGRRLLEILLGHLDADARASAAAGLERATAEAAAYGALARSLGASLTETLELFLRFRSSFVGELAGVARRRRLDTRAATALLVRAEAAMDRLLVALMKGFEGGEAQA
jgi:excisionase family DNA binding protein